MNNYIKPVIYTLAVLTYAVWNVNCLAQQGIATSYSKPSLSASNSFIEHESGVVPSSGPKNIPQGPSVSQTSGNNQNTQTTSPTNRRDYVNPNRNSPNIPVTTNPIRSPQGSNTRDYVNPNRNTQNIPVTTSPIRSPQGSNTRDYVNPNRNTQNIPVTTNPFRAPQVGNTRDYVNPNRPSGNVPQNSVNPTGNISQGPGNPTGMLGSLNPTTPRNTQGLRDYVNPNRPTGQISQGRPVEPSSTPNPAVTSTPRSQQLPRRDYVNPNIPTRQPSSGVNTQQSQQPSFLSGGSQSAFSIPLQPQAIWVNSPSPTNSPTDPNTRGNSRPKPEFPALPKSRGSTTPAPTNIGGGVISYAQKVSGGSTTKSPVQTGTSSTTGSPTPSPTTEKPLEGPTDDELREFSEALLRRDVNNAARFVTVNYQGKTTSQSQNDEAPNDLLQVQQEAFQIPTIAKLILLHNNYILQVNENEHVTPQEKAEENDLIDTMLTTPIMQFTRNYLVSKNKISPDPKDFRDYLKQIWFSMYSRGGGKIGSSGFEHIFLAELKHKEVSGLHNWVYFDQAENTKLADYLGYMKKIDLGEKGAILKYHFKLNGVDKPVNSMFIGTSPELEMALYTTCYVFRPDRICPLRLAGHNFIIRTFTFRYRGKNSIGSAFPEI